MIPKNIRRKHILNAIQEIDRDGVPPQRKATKYQLELANRTYPPKYVIAVANKYANGEFLKSSKFGGGSETNNFLKKLGFKITQKTLSSDEIKETITDRKLQKRKIKADHIGERCPSCKDNIEIILENIYGRVERNYRFEMGTLPKHFHGYPQYQYLKNIFSALQDHGGYENFVRSKNIPRVDYYVPDPGFIIEYDESQHFTSARKMTLENYPETLDIGFDKRKWMDLCDQIQAQDNDPPFRDEQRAWYDTLRDFLPVIKGIKPTVRLYASDTEWCSLDPENQKDLKYLRKIVTGIQPHWHIDALDDPDPELARIIIAGQWNGELELARKLLEDLCNYWPEGKRVDCLITCGAFINFSLPHSLHNIGDNRFPNQEAVGQLISKAEAQTRNLLTNPIREKLMNFTDYITVGVDSKKEKVSLNNTIIKNPHIELVALVDLKTNQYKWTGKSYPTTGQQEGLIRIVDETSHIFDLPFGKVLILGCHDLSISNSRGKAVTKAEWKKNIRRKFYKLVKDEKPEVVFHHPHTTDSFRTWLASWNELKKTGQTIEKYIGSGIYYRKEGERSPLIKVLRKTKQGESIDFVVHI